MDSKCETRVQENVYFCAQLLRAYLYYPIIEIEVNDEPPTGQQCLPLLKQSFAKQKIKKKACRVVPYARIGLILFPLFFFPSVVILLNPFPICQCSVGQTTDILWLTPLSILSLFRLLNRSLVHTTWPYYLDDNCSYSILNLTSALRRNMDMTGSFNHTHLSSGL